MNLEQDIYQGEMRLVWSHSILKFIIFSVYVTVYVCVDVQVLICVCVCWHAHAWACLQKLEANFGCHPEECCHLLWSRVSHWPGAWELASSGCPLSPSDLPGSTPQLCDYNVYRTLSTVLGTQVLTHAHKCFTAQLFSDLNPLSEVWGGGFSFISEENWTGSWMIL